MLTGAMVFSATLTGKVSMVGNGCYGNSQMVPVSGTEDRYTLPIKVKMDKKSGSAFDRKTCNVRLPVSLNPNEKLQISDILQVVHLNGNSVKSTLNISVVGKKTKPLVSGKSQVLKMGGLVVESACGRDTIVTGNLNVLATGNGAALAETDAVVLTLKVVSCN